MRMEQLSIAGSGVPSKIIVRCVVCGRLLKSEKWAHLGIGPVCAKKNPHLLPDEDAHEETGNEVPSVPDAVQDREDHSASRGADSIL